MHSGRRAAKYLQYPAIHPTIDMELPRNENILASLVRACIRGGTKDLAAHLDGATMRPYVVLQLLKLVRSGGYPSYEDKGVNA